MRKAVLIISLLFTLAAAGVSAQTEYDIRVFLENLSLEAPDRAELGFYLSAGDRLLHEGRMEEANIFYDYAASVGAPEGFLGKSRTEDRPMAALHLALSQRTSVEAERLMDALSSSGTDIRSAVLVHDNILVYGLTYLRDPLLEWMPRTREDTLFLKRNDSLTYMIALLKEENGNRFDALALYELAAWEGNYDALKKVKGVGCYDERRQKAALIERMNKDRKLVLIHKYFAGEHLSGDEYSYLAGTMENPDDELIVRALGFYNPDSVNQAEPDELHKLAQTFAAAIRFRATQEKRSEKGDYVYDMVISSDSQKAREGFRKKQESMRRESNRNEEDTVSLLPLENQLKAFDEFCETIRNGVISRQAVSTVRKYYKHHPEPWSEEVLDILNTLETVPGKTLDRSGNIYYPLYETGLFSRLHRNRKVTPERIELRYE